MHERAAETREARGPRPVSVEARVPPWGLRRGAGRVTQNSQRGTAGPAGGEREIK